MKMTLEEMETVISWNRADNKAVVYCSDIYTLKRLNRLYGDKVTRTFTQNGEVIAKEFTIDRRMVSFRSKLAEPKPLTEEERERRREQMKRIRAQQMARKKG
jgi:hypothetical protein